MASLISIGTTREMGEEKEAWTIMVLLTSIEPVNRERCGRDRGNKFGRKRSKSISLSATLLLCL